MLADGRGTSFYLISKSLLNRRTSSQRQHRLGACFGLAFLKGARNETTTGFWYGIHNLSTGYSNQFCIVSDRVSGKRPANQRRNHSGSIRDCVQHHLSPLIKSWGIVLAPLHRNSEAITFLCDGLPEIFPLLNGLDQNYDFFHTGNVRRAGFSFFNPKAQSACIKV
jgi:hypothetical protein